MKAIELLKSPPLCIEIGQGSVKILDGETFLELALERDGAGRLTAASAEQFTATLKQVAGKSPLGRRRTLCAIGARGVSLRRIAAPPRKEKFQQLLALQVEREFPLAPDELAWGVYENGSSLSASGAAERVGHSATQAAGLTVAAVKRDAIEEYSRILAAAGLDAVFTLGVLAIPALCPRPPRSYAVLDIRRHHSELVVFEQGVPAALRILPVGGGDFFQALSQALGISREAAEQLRWDDRSAWPGAETVQPAVEPVAEALAGAIRAVWTGQRIYLAGGATRVSGLAGALEQTLGGGADCERIDVPPGHSATLFGLKKWCESGRRNPPLLIQTSRTDRAATRALQPAQWKWAAAAGLLLLCLLALRYAEPLLKGPGLSKRLADIKAQTTDNPEIDSELSFLQFMETNRPPYLEVLAAVGDAAARGTRIESLTMNRRGEVSFRGTMQNSQEATNLRAKLIESGLFSRVVLDEQSPTQDRKVQVRITARWLPPRQRPPSPARESLEPPKPEPMPQGPLSPTFSKYAPPPVQTNSMKPGSANSQWVSTFTEKRDSLMLVC